MFTASGAEAVGPLQQTMVKSWHQESLMKGTETCFEFLHRSPVSVYVMYWGCHKTHNFKLVSLYYAVYDV